MNLLIKILTPLSLCSILMGAKPVFVTVIDTPVPAVNCIEQRAQYDIPSAIGLTVFTLIGVIPGGCSSFGIDNPTIYISLTGPSSYIWAANGFNTPDGLLGHELAHALYGDFHPPSKIEKVEQ